MKSIKQWLSLASFVSSVVIGYIAIFIPPRGIIDSSILWFTAQLLLFTSSLLGIDFNINRIK